MFTNKKTGHSQAEKPASWDGEYIIGEGPQRDVLYDKTFGDFTQRFCTKMEEPDAVTKEVVVPSQEPLIGAWEEVAEVDDFYK